MIISQLEPKDYKEAGRLLYWTDPYIYPIAFKNEDIAGRVFPLFFEEEGGAFTADNIIVASIHDKIAGAAVVLDDPFLKRIDYSQITSELTYDEGYQHVSQNYFNHLLDDLEDEKSVYIACLVVAKQYRHQGIGKAMLKYIIEKYGDSSKISLHALQDNEAAVKLYESQGFVIIEKNLEGYAYKEEKPLCVKMEFDSRVSHQK